MTTPTIASVAEILEATFVRSIEKSKYYISSGFEVYGEATDSVLVDYYIGSDSSTNAAPFRDRLFPQYTAALVPHYTVETIQSAWGARLRVTAKSSV